MATKVNILEQDDFGRDYEARKSKKNSQDKKGKPENNPPDDEEKSEKNLREKLPGKKFLVIACSEPNAYPHVINLEDNKYIELGDAFMVRNFANMVPAFYQVMAEIIATYLLVFVICSAAALSVRVSKLGASVAGVLIVTVMIIYAVRQIFDAHMILQTAVTLAFATFGGGHFLWKQVAEFIAKCMSVFVTRSAAALGVRVSKLGASVAGVLIVTVMIYAVGHIFGANMNLAAVTLAFAAVGHFTWKQLKCSGEGADIEYAIDTFEVKNILFIGHKDCRMRLTGPRHVGENEDQQRQREIRAKVENSLRNLQTYPYVQTAMETIGLRLLGADYDSTTIDPSFEVWELVSTDAGLLYNRIP